MGHRHPLTPNGCFQWTKTNGVFWEPTTFLHHMCMTWKDMHDMNWIAAMSDMHAVYICILYIIYIYINDYPIHDDAWLAAVANHHMNTKALQTGHMKAFGRTRYLWRCVCPTKPNLVRRTRRILEDPNMKIHSSPPLKGCFPYWDSHYPNLPPKCPAPVEVGSLSHYFQRFYTSQVVVWDFFHQQ